ncbi:hypothetical protein K378_01499 [Streptomyces sp. Amel2xB2]|uniref:Uncharacterized protein n=1 Tax=Streptomyces nanshensis TaxID=518642 RepID=A0A1E7L6X3_9ACTN|nr:MULTISPECIES: hypothetical protein [Streptomyces]OEV11920.1 hypothetical protein AN218_10800 [Streptomyces nanshensis]RAJ70334.1 hypothetical protein K378_01499 [Streptomyces sp. Amel2xB2]
MPEMFREAKSAAECAECARLLAVVEKAAREYDRSAETDARVRLRRHARAVHGRELPLPW